MTHKLHKVLTLAAIAGIATLISYIIVNADVPGNTYNQGSMIYTVYTTSADSQTLGILEKYYFEHRLEGYYVIDDTANKAIFPAFPDSNKILLGASIKELSNAKINQARSHGFTSNDIIAYDIENWTSTPFSEQLNAAESISKAAEIVHGEGYSYGVTPDQKILLKWYRQVDWTEVDFLALQFQTLAGDTGTLVNLTRTVSEHVKSANPEIEVFVQLSLRHSTAKEIGVATETLRPFVDGVIIAYLPDVTKPPCRYCTPQELEKALDHVANIL